MQGATSNFFINNKIGNDLSVWQGHGTHETLLTAVGTPQHLWKHMLDVSVCNISF